MSLASQVTVSWEKPVDREKVCPFLLRVFCQNDRHNPVQEFMRGITPANELQMYTWMDCNLKELTSLIKEVNPEARRRDITFDFSIVSPEKHNPRYVSRDIGTTQNGSRGVDDTKTLQMCKFEIGDYIDVAISAPRDERLTDRRFNNRYERREDNRRRDRPVVYRG